MENENLDELEEKLKASLAEVQRKKAEIEKEKEIERKLYPPVSLTITSIQDKILSIKNDYRQDVVAMLTQLPGRVYKGFGSNTIPVESYPTLVEETKKLKNVTLSVSADLALEIEHALRQPKWTVKLDKRFLKLIPGPKHSYWDVQMLPNIKKDERYGYYEIPLSEGWRLLQTFKNMNGDVYYHPDAFNYIESQIAKRESINDIAKAKDWPYDVEFADKNVTLRPAQKVGAAFIEASDYKTLLAYQMGLGKTIISLAVAIKNNFRTMIVCPAALRPNWCREIYRLTGQKPQVLIGTEPSEYDLKQMILNPSQYVVANYDILSKKSEYDDITIDQEGHKHIEHKTRFLWIDVINMARFDMVIIDESHYIKNTDSNRSQAIRRLKVPRIIHMTGTPVLNRPGELWPILTMLQPETFPAEETFIRQYTYDGKIARNVDELREVLKPIMIRRKQSDVVDEVPPLNRITEYHDLSKKAIKIYNKILDGIYQELQEFEAKRYDYGQPRESKVTHILAKIQRLKMVCAIDKVDQTSDLAMNLQDSASEGKHNKILIFSQYKAVAYAIHQRLGHESLCFVEIGKDDFHTVDNNERDRRVQEFQNNSKIKYLVVTEKTAKEGHNITEAGYVIFNDLFWTPAAHEQGEGRAYMRINDPHGIDAYYMVTDMDGDSIEEWIWALLQRKMAVINQTVEGVEASRDVSVANELIAKLKESMFTRRK